MRKLAAGLTIGGVLAGASMAVAQDQVIVEEEVVWQRYFFEVGYSLTGASAHPGMRAASLPALVNPADNPQFDGIPYNDAYIPPGMGSCDVAAEEYCVRVNRPGLTFAHGVHLGFGGFITPRWGLSARVRIAPAPRDGGTMHNVVVGLRGHYKLSKPRNTGFHSSIFIGGMAGQIQVRPNQQPTAPATTIEQPWAQTGLGGAEIGVKLGYRFLPNVGVFASPEAYVMFPDVSMGVQVTAGMDFAFGPVKRRTVTVIPAAVDEVAPKEDDAETVAQVDDTPKPPAGFVDDGQGRWHHDTPVLFELNSAQLDPNSFARLDTIAVQLNEDESLGTLEVVGHADERGPERLNDRLAEERGAAVRDYLLEYGEVAPERVRSRGVGANEPLVPNAAEDRDHAKNRRVEMWLRAK